MAFPDGWNRKCALTVAASQVGADGLVYYSVPLTKGSLPSEMFDADGSYPALSAGGDVRFSLDSDGATELPSDLIDFVTDNDPANGKALIRVKMPSLSSVVDNPLYVWYNNPTATRPAVDAANGQYAAYDEHWRGYWPLGSDLNDRTSYQNHATAAGGLTAGDTTGPLGAATSFDGSEYAYVDDDDSLDFGDSWDFTLSYWVKTAAANNGGGLEKGQVSLARDPGYSLYLVSSTNGFARVGTAASLTAQYEDIGGVTQGTWSHLAATFDRSDVMETYSNGGVDAGDYDLTTYTGTVSNANQLWIGRVARDYLIGDQAEAQVHGTLRAPAWITTEYNATNSPATFATAGTPENAGLPELTMTGGFAGSTATVDASIAVGVSGSGSYAGSTAEVDASAAVGVAATGEYAGSEATVEAAGAVGIAASGSYTGSAPTVNATATVAISATGSWGGSSAVVDAMLAVGITASGEYLGSTAIVTAEMTVANAPTYWHGIDIVVTATPRIEYVTTAGPRILMSATAQPRINITATVGEL